MAARFGPPGELNLPIGNSLGDHDAVAVVTYSRVRRIQGAHRERCSRRKIGIPVGICWRRVSQAGCRSTTGIRDAPELPNGQDIGAANVRVIEPRQFDSRAARASERAPVLGRSIAASTQLQWREVWPAVTPRRPPSGWVHFFANFGVMN